VGCGLDSSAPDQGTATMTESRHHHSSLPDNPTRAEPPMSKPGTSEPHEEDALGTSDHRRPSEEATADIEERQDSARAKTREAGRPPSDAPAYQRTQK
jgi:hypothetical protein